jgi:2-aminoadipate transaminase
VITREKVAAPDLFSEQSGVISFAGGMPNLSVIPWHQLADDTDRLLRLGGPTVLQYTTPTVSRGLRRAIDALMAMRGVPRDPRSVITTAGSQMGLAAVAQLLVRPGDVVVCEAPTYPGAISAFTAAGARIVPVDITSGVTVESVTAALGAADARVAFYYTNPVLHNPTGRTLTAEERAAVVSVCRSKGITIVEDDPYGLLGFDPAATQPDSYVAVAPDTIYLGTFSKVFAPGLRVGWISAPDHLCSDLAFVVEAMTLAPPTLNHAIVAGFFSLGDWRGLIDDYRAAYRRQAQAMTQGLTELLGDESPWQWDEPSGGFYVWLSHRDTRVDTRELLPVATAAGANFVPGAFFGADGAYRNCIRLCFSANDEQQTAEGVRRLAPVLRDFQGAT